MLRGHSWVFPSGRRLGFVSELTEAAARGPRYAAAAVWWGARWVVRYWILRQPYTGDDAIYMTQMVLRNKLQMQPSQWRNLPDDKRDEFVAYELWVPANLKRCVHEHEETA